MRLHQRVWCPTYKWMRQDRPKRPRIRYQIWWKILGEVGISYLYWVVVTQTFFIFTPIWGNDHIWLIFFKWVETTNQLPIGYMGRLYIYLHEWLSCMVRKGSLGRVLDLLGVVFVGVSFFNGLGSHGIHHHLSPTFGIICWYFFSKRMQIFRDLTTESQMTSKGCTITSSAQYLGSVTILRKWLDPRGMEVYTIFGETDSICCNVIGLIPDRNVSYDRMLFHL